ncbi:MAG: LptF/LptG family permease [Alphaproteobacteria bacterium]|nr:LptF/LptG family permease [Alphaproteobacteria bacterium]
MKILSSNIFKNLWIATTFIAVVLAFILFLTQSLKFLEIVINSGTSSSSFLILTSLALPRFFEVILPLSVMAGTIFFYNKMMIDSELVAMRSTGFSSFSIAKPALILGVFVTVILWFITMWIAPASLARMQNMRLELKTEFSAMLFKQGVFNQVGNGLTVYIQERLSNGELAGLMIHDTRDTAQAPSTVLAKRGVIVSDAEGQQVIVFDGSRQSFDPKSGILQRLAFDRYTIDLPENEAVRQRWAEPDERTIFELLHPDQSNKRDMENLKNFRIELHRRFTGPLLALTFPLIVLSILLIGPVDRRGQSRKIIVSVVAVMLIQGAFIASYNLAQNHFIGLFMMYALVFMPVFIGLFFLSGRSEKYVLKITEHLKLWRLT